MTQALTLTEAAERLAPVFTEGPEASLPDVAKPAKGKWLSLDDAASVLTQRVTGQLPKPKKKREDVTVEQAAQQIEQPYADLTGLREARENATVKLLMSYLDLEDVTNRAVQQFQGRDDMSVLTSPEYQAVYAYVQQFRTTYDAAIEAERETWQRQCVAENDAFEALRPDWSQADAQRVLQMLRGMGLAEHEIKNLWELPTRISLENPVCLALAKKAIGAESQNPIPEALASVGFSEDEIKKVYSLETPLILRDYRIQELVARAADADTQTEDRAAA